MRRLRDVHQLIQHLLGAAERLADSEALMHQRRDQHLPSGVQRAEQILFRHPHVLEKNLIEFRLAGDLLQRTHRHAGTFHIDDQRAHPLMLRRVGIGPHEQLAEVRAMRDRGPHLLPVDDKLVAFKLRAARYRREIRARARLRHPLAPDFLARENRLQVALFLLVGAPLHQRRPVHDHAEHVASHRQIYAREFLVEDQLLDKCRTAAAVFLGPREPGPARVEQLRVPGLQPFPVFLVAAAVGIFAARTDRFRTI